MKRLCAFLLSLILIVALAAPIMPTASVSAASDVVYTIQTVTSNGIKAGETFTVKISTNKVPKICMVEFFFAYDAKKVKPISGSAKGFLADFAFSKVNIDPVEPKHVNPNIGEVWITGMDLNDHAAASGEVIATIRFEALSDIKADLKLYSFQKPLAAYAPANPLTTKAVDGGIKMPVTAKIIGESETGCYAFKDEIVSAKVTAIGDGLTYTWYVKGPDATAYTKSSVTTATYETKMTAANSGRRVYCVVKDAYGNKVQSKTFMLRMKATITSEPATAAYAKMGNKVSLKIGAVGDGLKYEWYTKGADRTEYTKSSITGATYTTAISDASKGRRVYCLVTDKYGKTDQSKTFILRESVSITKQPKSAYGKNGTLVSTTVKARGDGLTYTWYVKNAGQTEYLQSSVTGSTYTTKMNSSSKDRLVACVVTDKYGKEVRTKTVQLIMTATITSEPATAAYAKIGDKVSLKIGAVGDGLKYEWYTKGADRTEYTKSSLTGATYTTAINSTSKGRRVYCLVTDKRGNTARSKTFILRESVSITKQPRSAYGSNGSLVSTTVKASGDGLTYTWYVKNAGQTEYTKSSVTGPTYTTKMNNSSKDRLVACLVKDKYGNKIRTKTVQLLMK